MAELTPTQVKRFLRKPGTDKPATDPQLAKSLAMLDKRSPQPADENGDPVPNTADDLARWASEYVWSQTLSYLDSQRKPSTL